MFGLVSPNFVDFDILDSKLLFVNPPKAEMSTLESSTSGSENAASHSSAAEEHSALLRMEIQDSEKHVLLEHEPTFRSLPKHSSARHHELETTLSELKRLPTPNSSLWTTVKIAKWYSNHKRSSLVQIEPSASQSQPTTVTGACSVRAFVVINGVETDIPIQAFRKKRVKKRARLDDPDQSPDTDTSPSAQLDLCTDYQNEEDDDEEEMIEFTDDEEEMMEFTDDEEEMIEFTDDEEEGPAGENFTDHQVCQMHIALVHEAT
ncbi:MAG: hypothetical protein KJ043_23880, partial [Anaerolineae bacterium]|nr:hypothetical protein [Anaerolineae bacterium]